MQHDTSSIDNRAPNVAVQFRDRVRTSSHQEAFRYPKGETWESVTWSETGERVTVLAAGLIALGIESEQRVGIASGTRFEWILADLAIMSAGGATTTVYPSSNGADVSYILADSDCRVVFAEDDEQVEKIRDHRSELPHLTKVVVFAGATNDVADDDGGDDDWVIGLAELEKLGSDLLTSNPTAVDDAVDNIRPDALATLIYTSGTTGRPKGVRLRHESWTYEGAAIQALDILHEDDLQFLWLPMAHSFGKVLLSAQMACGFATAIDGRVDKIIDNLAVVRPTFMGAAPRIFEKAHGRITTMQAAEGGAKEAIFTQAFKVGLEVDRLHRDGKPVPLPLKVQHAI
ncbi:MAG: AMP-binding protein, partial [Nocardioidaceae bacterium]|nr:AMP-binding protein [Nocardioidaceae bacterium]